MSILVPSARDGGVCGYVTAGGAKYAVRVRTGKVDAFFEADPRLRAVLAGHEAAVHQRLQRNAEPAPFLTELAELIERVVAREDASSALGAAGGDGGAAASAAAFANVSSAALPSASFYELLIQELDTVGWGMLISVSPLLDELELLVDDAAGRGHVLRLSLPPDYPRSPPRARVALPAPFELRWPQAAAASSAAAGGSHTLSLALSQFREALAHHQRLWDMLDDLDANTWVLEPKNPTRDCTTRRIALGDHCSLQLELHVGSPSSLPDLQFLGADRVIAPLRQALNANLSQWQPDRALRLNLEAVLQRAFPSRQSADAADAEEYSIECCICYSYHLDGSVPEIACDGCGKPYHVSCLSEWLRGLPTTQQSFNRLFGECAYCGHNIACEAQQQQRS